MPDRVVVFTQPMLYVTTLCSARASTVASEVKASLATVRDFLTRRDAAPAGYPTVCFSGWDGRLVTIEAGYPVIATEAVEGSGRVLSGSTPGGAAMEMVHRGSPFTLDAARSKLNTDVAATGSRVTGLSWEVYLDGDGSGPADTTALYVQLLEPPIPSPTPSHAAI